MLKVAWCVACVVATAAVLTTQDVESQLVSEDPQPSIPLPVYPTVTFQVLNVDHVLLRKVSPSSQGNSSLKAHIQTFLITDSGPGLLQPTVNASFGPLTVDAPIAPNLLHSGRKILPVIVGRQVHASSPTARILFHMSAEAEVKVTSDEDRMRTGKDRAHCVTAYAFWGTREVRGSCLVSPGGFCVAQLNPEPAWFNPSNPAGSSSKETGRSNPEKGVQENLVEVYFQSRRDRTGQCVPQDSLQRAGRGGVHDGTGTPMRRIGSVTLLQSPPGHPAFFRLRLGGAVVIQTSSKPLKTNNTATFNIYLAGTSALETFTLRTTMKSGMAFSTLRASDSASWDVKAHPGSVGLPNTVSFVCKRKVAVTSKRGLLEVLQVDFLVKDVSEQAETHIISWRLDQPGNVRDVGQMRLYTSQRDYVGLAPVVLSSELLNTAVLTGKMLKVAVKTLAVEANGSVSDVSSFVSCRSTDRDVLKVSERCDYVFVTGKELRGKSSVMINFMYAFLSAQLEMSVWTPQLPLTIDVADPELHQIKGWRVPITTSNRKPSWNSEEEEEMRKGRGCMLQYQHSPLRVLTHFVADSQPLEYFLGPDWRVDVTNLVRPFLKVLNPQLVRLQDGVLLQGRAVGTTAVQVLSPLTGSVLAEKSVTVLADKVSVTDLKVDFVSGLSLSLQPSPAGNKAIVAVATTRDTLTRVRQEAVVSCRVQFSDGAVTPLSLFDRGDYSLTVTTPDEGVASVRRTPLSTFVVAQGEGRGKAALVKVELRICEECQKSKRKSKLAVGAGLLRIDFQGGDGGAISLDRERSGTGVAEMAEMAVEATTTVTSSRELTDVGQELSRTEPERRTLWDVTPSGSQPTVTESWLSASTASRPTRHLVGQEDGQNGSFGNMLDKPKPAQEPEAKLPKVVESDLVRTFRSMSDLEIGIYCLAGVLCVAIFGFLLNCASYRLCLRSRKTPVLAGPAPPAEPKDHKHDWVWLANNPQQPPPPGAPAQVSTLTRTPPAVQQPVPERTATLGRGRSGSQQQQHRKAADPVAQRSATLLARPSRSEPLRSPTSKRNQVQFTTFTTLDIKHLAALKTNDFQPPPPAGPHVPLPDMPWPVVTPLQDPQ
ncbi:transmembrane protein 132D-like [Entelurus aequoreus]|uniref:transmembrane protein 132D-like n=1 Tax=Entelurus aequoreus TaxID=161455 RepID=UPI002B1E2ABE|nr:transmembrane protein 132D-like [Entelurus aequoreus]XP_061913017.1 transmembrane protein 132D-like [Entelurus aequoreus]